MNRYKKLSIFKNHKICESKISRLKRSYFFLIFFLISCSSTSHWKNDQMSCNLGSLHSLIYRDPQGSLELEFYKMQNDIYGFIDCPKIKFDRNEIGIIIERSNVKYLFWGSIRNDHKIKLSKEALDFLLDNFAKNERVIIELNQFEESVDLSTFSKNYKKFLGSNSYSLLKSPF